MKKIIPDFLRESKRIALKDMSGAAKTYEKIFFEANGWKNIMEKRCIVCILCDKTLETVSFIMEMFIIQVIPILLPADIDDAFLENLAEKYKFSYLWCLDGRTVKGTAIKAVDKHLLFQCSHKDYEVHSDLGLLLSTSGSTGSPKMVRLSYDNLIYNIETAIRRYGIVSEHKTITILPLHHIWGLQFCMWHWYAGAEVLISDHSVMTRGFKDFYRQEKTNNIAGVPYTYQMMKKAGFWDSETLDMLHVAMCAGAPLQKKTQDYMANLARDKFWSQYGQTESTGALLGCNFEKPDQKAGIIGRPLDGTGVSIEADEIILAGRGICMGYAYSCDDLSHCDDNNGILYTGDMGIVDMEGNVYITGRKSRFVKLLGERISLDEIEGVLGKQEKAIEFACVGDADRLDIFYTGDGARNPAERQWIHFLNSTLKIPIHMIHIHKIEAIPRNGSGKVLYEELKRGCYQDEGNC